MTVGNGEGAYFADEATLDRLEGEGRVVFRYRDNPNGSARAIAGIVNESGNVLGLMPHPDRAFEDDLGSSDGAPCCFSRVTGQRLKRISRQKRCGPLPDRPSGEIRNYRLEVSATPCRWGRARRPTCCTWPGALASSDLAVGGIGGDAADLLGQFLAAGDAGGVVGGDVATQVEPAQFHTAWAAMNLAGRDCGVVEGGGNAGVGEGGRRPVERAAQAVAMASFMGAPFYGFQSRFAGPA